MTTTKWLAALTVLLTPFAAMAQTPADDVKCLLVSSTFAQVSKDEAARQLARSATAFYLGRLDGRQSPAALKAQLTLQSTAVNRNNAGPVMNACTARMREAETRLQALAPKPAGK